MSSIKRGQGIGVSPSLGACIPKTKRELEDTRRGVIPDLYHYVIMIEMPDGEVFKSPVYYGSRRFIDDIYMTTLRTAKSSGLRGRLKLYRSQRDSNEWREMERYSVTLGFVNIG